jgi:hypothetical protein
MPPTNKPASRSWTDIQMVLAALSMALTLGLWNLFAEPDRVAADQKAQQQPPDVPPSEAAPVLAAPTVPTQAGPIKILLGGVAPQTVITVQQPRGGGGGGPVPHTRSS